MNTFDQWLLSLAVIVPVAGVIIVGFWPKADATGMNGTFIAQDLILFFVFFELVLLPMYFMIGVWGGENRQYASIKFFLFTLFGSALMILSFLALYFKAGNTFDIPRLIETAAHID